MSRPPGPSESGARRRRREAGLAGVRVGHARGCARKRAGRRARAGERAVVRPPSQPWVKDRPARVPPWSLPRSASAVCEDPEQVVQILDYTITGKLPKPRTPGFVPIAERLGKGNPAP